MMVVVLFLSGCTKRLNDSNNKPVIEPNTGQALTENILCQPKTENITNIYKENGVDLDKIPTCQSFSVTSGGYEGIWTTFFVKPLAWLIIKLGEFAKSYGVSIILTTLLIRIGMSPMTKKTAQQSENLKAARPELDSLEKKYKNTTDKDSMLAKSQEMMIIYKKYNIKPASGCLFAFVQIPLFFAYYEALMRIPVIFEESFLSFNLGTNPSTAISNGQYQYVIFIVLIVVATYLSFTLNSTAAGSTDQEKQMKNMMKFMVVMIFVASLTLPSGLALYWITNNAFTIGQNLLSKRRAQK